MGVSALVAATMAGCGSSTGAKRQSGSSGGSAAAAAQTSLGTGVQTGQSSSGNAAAVTRGGILKLANTSDYDYYDGTSYAADIWSLEFLTCNGLLDYPDTTGPDASALQPGIAQDMPTVSADGLTYTFKIRTGIRFSNGAEVTPQDVIGTYERMLDPNAEFSPLISGYYNGIVGVDKYAAVDANGKPLASDPKTISGITANGQDVSFKLTKPDPSFLYATALRFACIVPAGSSHKHTTLPPPMTGPYTFTEVQPNREFKIRRNPVWAANVKAGMPQAAGSNNIDGIDYSIMSPEQMLLKLKGNALDVNVDGSSLAGANANAIGDDAAYKSRFFSFDDASTSYWYFNDNAASPMQNLKLRQAVNYAIDRQGLLKLSGGKFIGSTWSQFLPSNLLAPGAATNLFPASPDLAKAKQLIQESGVRTPIKINLYFPSGGPVDQPAQNVAQSLKQVGFDVTLKGEGPSVYYQDIQDPKAARDDIGFASWAEDYSDASTYFGPVLDSASADGGSNYGDFKDPTLDAAIAKIDLMPLGAARVKAWSDLSTQTMETLTPVASFRNRRRSFLVSDRVEHFQFNPTKGNYWGLVSLK